MKRYGSLRLAPLGRGQEDHQPPLQTELHVHILLVKESQKSQEEQISSERLLVFTP